MTTLLVASSGGHLKQLHSLRPRLQSIDPDVTWVTFDTAQSRSLLAGEDVVFGHQQESRDYRACGRNLAAAVELLRRRRFTNAVSTGAGLALAYLPVAAARGTKCHYIESATRSSGPSLTGNALRRAKAIHMYTQYRAWESRSWAYRGSVFDGYLAEPATPRPIRRAVVTVGTLDTYPFPRMLRAVMAALPPDVETLWQVGPNAGHDLPGGGRKSVPAREFERALAEADVVIAHCGTGSALAALEAGKCPVLVPRRHEHGEHVDNHQLQIAEELGGTGLAVIADPDDLSLSVLEQAACRSIVRAPVLTPFQLN